MAGVGGAIIKPPEEVEGRRGGGRSTDIDTCGLEGRGVEGATAGGGAAEEGDADGAGKGDAPPGAAAVGVEGGLRAFLGLRRDLGVCQPPSGGGVSPRPVGDASLARKRTCLVGLSIGQLGRGGGGGRMGSKPSVRMVTFWMRSLSSFLLARSLHSRAALAASASLFSSSCRRCFSTWLWLGAWTPSLPPHCPPGGGMYAPPAATCSRALVSGRT